MTQTTIIPLGIESPPACRVGIDLVCIADVADSVARLGQRYLNRVFTGHELSCCVGTSDVAAASLAARLAAKEATIKVLRPSGAQPAWRSIEVVRLPSGACELALYDTAARMAAAAGLGPLSVSLTHEAGFAAAVVVAMLPQGGQSLAAPAFDEFVDSLTVIRTATHDEAEIYPEKGRQNGRFWSDEYGQF